MFEEITSKLLNLIYNLTTRIEANNLINKIREERITLEEISKVLSKYDKNYREELINLYKYDDMFVYDALQKANDRLERNIEEEYINSVKNNTYKEYLSKLKHQQLYDLMEYLTHRAHLIRLSDNEKYKEYETYLEILQEKESILTKALIIDLDSLEETLKASSPEEIARYLKNNPHILNYISPDEELNEKIIIALDILNENKDSIEAIEDEKIYKKRKHF